MQCIRRRVLTYTQITKRTVVGVVWRIQN